MIRYHTATSSSVNYLKFRTFYIIRRSVSDSTLKLCPKAVVHSSVSVHRVHSSFRTVLHSDRFSVQIHRGEPEASTILLIRKRVFRWRASLRHFVPLQHTKRIFTDVNGATVMNDSGFYFPHMDRNSPHSISGIVPSMVKASSLSESCELGVACGLPVTNSRSLSTLWVNFHNPPSNNVERTDENYIRQHILEKKMVNMSRVIHIVLFRQKSIWIPADEPEYPTDISYEYHKVETSPNKILYNFTVEGKSMYIFFNLV